MAVRRSVSAGLLTSRASLALVLSGLLAAGLVRDAAAGPVYTVAQGASISNIGVLTDVTDSFSNNSVGYVNASNPDTRFAQSFTSTGTAGLQVTNIVLGLFANSPNSSAQVRLFSNTLVGGTNVPGTALATYTLTGTSAIENTDTYNFAGTFTLAPSTRYWAVVSDSAAVSGSSSFSWVQSLAGAPTGSWGYTYNEAGVTRNGVNWATATSANPLSMQLIAVPEPGSLALLGTGTAVVAGGIARRRRRKVDGRPTPA